MPVDIALPHRPTYLAEPSVDSLNPELMTGNLTLVGKYLQSVQVKVYRTSLEHFAVIYPQKKVCRPLGVLNLRNTRVERISGGFVVRQRGVDTMGSLTFVCENTRELESWINAFTSRISPTVQQSPLPILQEDEEV